MVNELVKDFPIKAVVVWGAAYVLSHFSVQQRFILTWGVGCRYFVSQEHNLPVWEDKGALDLHNGFSTTPWQPGNRYKDLQWMTSLEHLPTLVIRNIRMRVGRSCLLILIESPDQLCVFSGRFVVEGKLG